MDNFGTVVARVQALTGDREGTVWDVPGCLPFGNIALDELCARLHVSNATAVSRTALITLPAGTVGLDFLGFFSSTGQWNPVHTNGSPSLPTDLIIPMVIEERTTGGTDKFNPMDPVEKIPLPDVDQDFQLKIWNWANETIWFLGALQSNDIRLTYEGAVPGFVDQNTILFVPKATNFVANKIAQMIVGGRNTTQASYFEKQAERSFDTCMREHIIQKQFAAHRRVPFGYKRVTFG